MTKRAHRNVVPAKEHASLFHSLALTAFGYMLIAGLIRSGNASQELSPFGMARFAVADT